MKSIFSNIKKEDNEEYVEITETISQSETISQPKPNPYKKPKVTYDDILTSLNLKVNNGKLEYIQKPVASHYDSFKTCYKKDPQFQTQTQTQTQQPTSQVQNSYIYNKYFKDYKDPQLQQQEEPVYLTRDEYKKRIILELVRQKQERKRISEIKSKKLLFARNNPSFSSGTYISPNLNKLFMFSR
jgi:hypothetical protein